MSALYVNVIIKLSYINCDWFNLQNRVFVRSMCFLEKYRLKFELLL